MNREGSSLMGRVNGEPSEEKNGESADSDADLVLIDGIEGRSA
jgi:hypothetical protein